LIVEGISFPADSLVGVWQRVGEDIVAMENELSSPYILPNILPPVDVMSDLGSSSLRWNDLYIDNIIASNNITLSSSLKSDNGGGQLDLDFSNIAGTVLLSNDNGGENHSYIKVQNSAITLQTQDAGSNINFAAPGKFTFTTLNVTFGGAEVVKTQDGVQTTNATTTYITNIPMSNDYMMTIQGRVNGFKDDYSAANGTFYFACFRKTGGVITQVGTTTISSKDDLGANVQVDTDGTNLVRVGVTGVVATTINWTNSYEYNFLHTN
jgi:hypothetical protein